MERRQWELEETDPSAVDLPVNQDVGCLQPVSKW